MTTKLATTQTKSQISEPTMALRTPEVCMEWFPGSAVDAA
jgi:hypothetical protein